MENSIVFYPGEIIVDFPVDFPVEPKSIPQKEGYEFRDNFWGFGPPENFKISGSVKVKLLKIPQKGLFCGQIANGPVFSEEIRQSFLNYFHMRDLIYLRRHYKIYPPNEWREGIEILFPNSYWSSTILPHRYAICSIKLLDGVFREINKWSSELVNPEEKISGFIQKLNHETS